MKARTSTRYVVVHHSASPPSTPPETIRQWHLARNYEDIGYHAVVWRDPALGGVWRTSPGRPLDAVGAHCRGVNSKSVGVCVCGDWRHPEAIPDLADAVTTVAILVDRLLLRYGLPLDAVVGHRDVGTTPTECPGRLLDYLRPALVRRRT